MSRPLVLVLVLSSLILASPPLTVIDAQTSGCVFRTSSTTAAFCDDLAGVSPGGRAGDLDDNRWSVGRVDGEFAPPNMMPFPASAAAACKSGVTSVTPDNDILVCDSASGHQGQFETALAAQNYSLLSLRPRQAFDFAGRTGTITYNVDAATGSPLGWWHSVYVTQDSVPGANNTTQVSGLTPRNGVGVNFDGNNCPGNLGTSVRVNDVFSYNGYTEQDTKVPNSVCIQTRAGSQNHIEIRLSQTSIEVWASDFSTDGSLTFPNFRMIGSTAINLNFSQGYVHFQHAQRAPSKYFGADPGSNYYWSKLGFDGPVVGNQETGYGVPDALTPNGGKLNIAYGLRNNPNSTFTCCPGTTVGPLYLGIVNTAGVGSAKLTFSVLYVNGTTFNASTFAVKYRFNGGAWHSPSPAPEFAKALACGGWGSGGGVCNWSMGFALPVALSDIVQGQNTVEIASDGSDNGYPSLLANVELLTFGGSVPPATLTPTRTSTPAPLTSTPTSTSTPVPGQCFVSAILNGTPTLYRRPLSFCTDQS